MTDFLHGPEVVTIDDGSRPISTASTSVIGIVGTAPEADEAEFPLNEPVLIIGSLTKAAKLGDSGTLPLATKDVLEVVSAFVVVVRVEEGQDTAETMSNLMGGVDSATGKYLGAQALLASKSKFGFAPRILIAPGFTHQRPEDAQNAGGFLKNPVAAALETVAGRVRGIVIADGPNTNDEDAKAARDDFGNKRVYLHDPWYQFWDSEVNGPVVRPSSAKVAATFAWNDNQNGWHTSPSNKPVQGIIGLGREIDFTLGDAACRANYLNSEEIATTIREDGYRLWGNRSTSEDAKWAFINHVRIADIINDSLLEAHLWAIDRNLTSTYYEDVQSGVQAFLDRMTAEGRIAGGTCWVNPDLNTSDDMKAGRAVFDFDFSPYGVAERITFRSRMVDDYLEEIL